MSFSLKINGRSFTFFRDFSFTFKYDSIASSFGFVALFDPDNQEHRNLFRPGTYPKIEVFFRNRLVLTGTVLNNKFKSSAKKQPLSLVGYSTTGVLQDSTLAKESYPLQFDGLTIFEIAQRCCAPFNIDVVVDPIVADEANSVLPQTEIKESQKIKDYLVEITTQKNLLLSHNEKGQLLITKAITTKVPIDSFGVGMSSTSLELDFNGQNMHSEISTLKQASVDTDNAGEGLITNPYVLNTLRVSTVSQSSGDDNDSDKFARSLLSSQLKNILVKVDTDRIQWRDGTLMLPNEIVNIQSDELFLFETTKFFVESVTIKGNNASTTASLKCVLPEVYNEEVPVNIFL